MASKNYNRYDKLEFIHYDDIDEYDTAGILNKFTDTADENFKEGKIELLNTDKYPPSIHYKDSSGKYFMFTKGLDYSSLYQSSLSDDGDVVFDAHFIYTTVSLDSGIVTSDIDGSKATQYNKMKSENSLNKSVITSKLYTHKSGTLFEIIQMVDILGISPLPELKGYNRYKLTYICKSYIDDKVYISKAIPNKSEGQSEAIVKIKEDGLIKEIMVNISFPTFTLGV